MEFIEGAWRIISIFPDSERLVVRKLRERFAASGDSVLTDCLVTTTKPEPQENYKGNVVVVLRNGGALTLNNTYRDDIFTVSVWGYNDEEVSHIARMAETYWQTIYGDGISYAEVEEPETRIRLDGEGFLRVFTGAATVKGASLP